MDEIQKVLIKAGRKDLAQKYYEKVSNEHDDMVAGLTVKDIINKLKKYKEDAKVFVGKGAVVWNVLSVNESPMIPEKSPVFMFKEPYEK